MPRPTRVDRNSLRPWQISALDAWESSDRRAIIAAATGTGKTRLALAAMGEVSPDWRSVVVVPTKSLQNQWISEITSQLRIRPDDVGTMGGSSPNIRVDHRVVVAVLNSARTRLPGLVDHWRSEGSETFLVVDECHWVGARSTATELFSCEYGATLGLSATPERGDDGMDDFLIPNLGDVAYRYPLRTALDDGLLSPLLAANVYIDLSEIEQHEYQDLEQQLLAATARGDDSQIARIVDKQRSVLRQAGGRTVALEALAAGGAFSGRRAILFHETIDQAERSADALSRVGVKHAVEHSKLSSDARAAALRRFETGSVDALVTVRALDEGIDVPAANLAVIVSGTMNPRQRIQRVGRVVRPSGGHALVITLLAQGTAEEQVVGANDSILFGRERVLDIRKWNSGDPAALVAYLTSITV